MADEITIKPKSESEPTPAVIGHEKQSVNTVLPQLINLSAAGLAAGFFLPWAQIFGRNISGFDLQRMGDAQLLLWLIPICCAITILAGFIKHSQLLVGQFTGLLPFVVGIYWYAKFGNDLFQILSFGAYLSLIFGLALMGLSVNAKQPKP